MVRLSITSSGFWVLFALSLAQDPQVAQAGVIISGTRHIYPEQRREITIQLSNDDLYAPRLVQAWLEHGDRQTGPESSDVPFSLSPPVFRMDPGKSQTMRLVYTQEPLPSDRESLFWLNVLEVPAKGGEFDPATRSTPQNQLRFAFRIRTKVFFRPERLSGKPQDAPAQLRWSLHQNSRGMELRVHNPSAYHVTFNEVALAMGPQPDARLLASEEGMVLPGATLSLALRPAVAVIPVDAQVHFKFINDFGGFSAPQRAVLNSGREQAGGDIPASAEQPRFERPF